MKQQMAKQEQKKKEHNKLSGMSKELINEMLSIEKKEGLTTENVVQRARDKKNILHDHFQWNNDIAGEQYRLHQAVSLINLIKIKINGVNTPYFENVNVNVGQREYKNVHEIKSNNGYRKQILKRAIEGISTWREQYERYEYVELKPIVNAVDKVKKEFEKNGNKK